MIQIIGWTILHSLWQITLIAALYWIGKRSIPKQKASTQYYVGISALIAALIAPMLTFYYLWSTQTTTFLSTTLAPITNDTRNPTVLLDTNEVVSLTPASFVDYLGIILPYLVAFWGIGVLYFTFRFVQNLKGINQLQRNDNELISREWQTKINAFSAQLGINKQVQVYLSTYIKEPLTFGHFKPVILLPISLITGFDTAAVETIILHELAHIKRHDYLVNLGQSIIEIILFYHPLVWWLSAEIRTVREHCCDDLVLAMGNNRTTYVETLTALQWRKVGGGVNRLSMTAIGADSDFSRRIKRMFGVEQERKFPTKKGILLLGLLLLFIGSGAWLNKKIATNVEVFEEDEITFVINEKTTRAALAEWTALTKKRGVALDFSPCVFNDNNELKEVRGSYRFDENTGDFFAKDLSCTNLKFVLNGNHLSQPTFLYPCRDKAAAEMGNIFHLNESTERKDLLLWAQKLADNNITFNFDESVFDKKGKIIEFNANYKDEHSRGSFSATDMSCSKFYYELVGQSLVGPTFLKEGEDPTFLGYKPLNLIHDETPGKIGFTIFEGMSRGEFGREVGRFQNITGAQITFDNITFYKDDTIVGGIKGKIRPNLSGQEIRYFEIHDLDKYSLQLTGRTNQVFAPTYIDNATKKIIKTKNVGSGEKSTFIANRKTTKAQLANWSKSILKHGVIFNYEKSVFDKNDQLIGLNGKFMGKCCYDDEFYINVEEMQVQLEIEDDYIYQPTITPINYNVNPKSKLSESSSQTINKESNAAVATVISRTYKELQDNWIYWGTKKIPFSGTFKIGQDGLKKLQVSTLEFTKEEWNYLYSESVTFYLDEAFFPIESMDAVVLVPKKKDPIMVKVYQKYHQLIKDQNEKLTRLMARAEVGDMLYFEKVNVGKDFTFGMVVEIIASPIDKSTGYLPSENFDKQKIDIDFQKAETHFSKGFIPAYQTPKQTVFNPSFLTEQVNAPRRRGGLIKIDQQNTYINGVKYNPSTMEALDYDKMESINVVNGLQARTLYGVEEAILITTKRDTSAVGSKK